MASKAKARFYVFLVVFIAILIAGGLIYGFQHFRESQKEPSAHETDLNPAPQPEPEPVHITIAATGDILIHNTVYFAAYDPKTNTYDFRDQFQHVRASLSEADLTIANLETTLGGPAQGYSGYPQFNTPDSIIEALKESGVDVLTAANNHRLDQGVPGFYRTINVVREKGLDIVGVKNEETEKTYVLKTIKGVKVAILNFGYGYPLENGSIDINGLILPASMSSLMDTFNPLDFQSSVQKITAKITKAKEEGAEIIVLCLHWGDEYHRQPNDFQQKLASELVNAGVHVIFGGHPHVLQPVEYIKNPQGLKVPVFYSLGNFISDQRQETVNNIYTEQGMIAKVTLEIKKGESPQVIAADGEPTWVNKKIINGKFFYEVIPVREALSSPDSFSLLNQADFERINFCQDTVKTLTKGL